MPQPYTAPSQISSGTLLLASPLLHDPYFHKSIILITDHHPTEGTLGYILNHPTHTPLHPSIPLHETSSLRKHRLYLGGPVQTNQVHFLSLKWDTKQDKLDFKSCTELTQAQQNNTLDYTTYALIGTSQWKPQQLQHELQQNTWTLTSIEAALPSILNPPEHNYQANTPAPLPDTLWQECYHKIGPEIH